MATTPITSFRIDDETKTRLQMLAEKQGVTMTDAIKSLVHDATADMIAVMSVDTIPVRDMMQNIGGVPTWTMFELDPQARRCWVTQEMSDNSTSVALWHGRNLSCKIAGHPAELEITNYLNGEGQALMQTVCNGHSVEWDGSNHVGHMTDDALAAWDELQADLENITDYYSLIDLHEWMSGDVEITGEETDGELQSLAEDIIGEAAEDGVILDGDVLEYLTELRDELRDA